MGTLAGDNKTAESIAFWHISVGNRKNKNIAQEQKRLNNLHMHLGLLPGENKMKKSILEKRLNILINEYGLFQYILDHVNMESPDKFISIFVDKTESEYVEPYTAKLVFKKMKHLGINKKNHSPEKTLEIIKKASVKVFLKRLNRRKFKMKKIYEILDFIAIAHAANLKLAELYPKFSERDELI